MDWINKCILIAILLISTSLFGQKAMINPYEAKMDSISISRLCLKLEPAKNQKHTLVTLKPHKKVKITMKTRLNFNVINKISVENGVDEALDDLNTDDYISLGSYDVRAKIYINSKIRLLTRVVVTGIQTNTYFYSSGLFINF